MFNYIFGLLFGPVLSYYLSKFLWRWYILWNARDPASEFSKLSIPPGDFGLPLVGETFLWAIEGSRFNFKRRKKYGKLFSTNFIGKTMVKVTGPEYVKQVLTAPHDTVATIWPTTVRCILGETSIANSTGSIHKYRRKVFMRAFTQAALARYIPQIHREVVRRMQIWANSSEPPLAYPEMKQLTFDVAFKVLVGLSFKDLEERKQLFQTFDTMISNLFSLPYNLPGSGFRKGLKAKEVIHGILDYHVKEKRRIVQKMIDEGLTVKDFDDGSTDNALHCILEAEMRDKLSAQSSRSHESSENSDKGNDNHPEKNSRDAEEEHTLSDVELKETTVEMLFAGYQTTASVSTSTLINLIQHPEVLKKLEDELREHGLLEEEEAEHAGRSESADQQRDHIPRSSDDMETNEQQLLIDNTVPTMGELRRRHHCTEDRKVLENNNHDFSQHAAKKDDIGCTPTYDGGRGESLTLEKLSKLQYLDQIMKETLRVMPPILGGYRRAIKSFKLGDYRVPKGWTIIYNIRDTHESEWSEDMNFRPERFSPESWKDNRESRYRWIPFGAGPRMCVGKEFARLQFKIFAIELVRHFGKFEFARGKPPSMFAIPFLHPTDGLPLKLTLRNQQAKDN